MKQSSARPRRVGEQIRRELATLLREENRNPELTRVSITEARVTRDFAYAKIFITFLGDKKDRPAITATLNAMAPSLRKQLSQCLRLRTVPKLEFIYDNSIEHGAELSALISEVVAEDRRKHRDD